MMSQLVRNGLTDKLDGFLELLSATKTLLNLLSFVSCGLKSAATGCLFWRASATLARRETNLRMSENLISFE